MLNTAIIDCIKEEQALGKHSPIYFDAEQGRLYVIYWEDNGNGETAHKLYIEGPK